SGGGAAGTGSGSGIPGSARTNVGCSATGGSASASQPAVPAITAMTIAQATIRRRTPILGVPAPIRPPAPRSVRLARGSRLVDRDSAQQVESALELVVLGAAVEHRRDRLDLVALVTVA